MNILIYNVPHINCDYAIRPLLLKHYILREEGR
jgi:hypothetical protein